MREYPRSEERTGVQEAAGFKSNFDVQSDFVMVYGFHDLKNRVKAWKKKGYVIHLMTGVAWGEYQDYLYGRYDGIDHHDEGQRNPDGSERGHGVDVPYMVPSNSFAHYLADNLKYAVDCGVEAIHLEEPEFWVETGYSDAFKREWKIYYKEDWQDPQSSCEAQYRASRLKQYLYTRTLDRLCSELKEYAMVKYKRLLRFYVPTHSLINYTQWKIVSPESALIDLPTVDGYIAQIWTGTSREPNTYHGITKERTFETAFLEYGVMQELVRGTGRRMWYLADPIEDNPRHTWEDYRANYYRTIVASLFHPEISDYEVSPWPARVMNGRHHANDEDMKTMMTEMKAFTEAGGNRRDFPADKDNRVIIPADYKTNLISVMHTLRDMADQKDSEWISVSPEVGVFMADSAMYQRICPEEGGDAGAAFSSFFGLALPLVKSGIAARPIQLDNISRYAGYLDAYRTVVLSYEFMKPSAPDIHNGIAAWVKNGGNLIYVGNDTDPFNRVREWWNTGIARYDCPSQHLFEMLGLNRNAAEGTYKVGSGTVTVIRTEPKTLADESAAADSYRDTVCGVLEGIGEKVEISSKLILRRGAYYVTAVMDEGDGKDVVLDGKFIDLFDSGLAVTDNPTLKPGDVHLWYDTARIDRTQSSDIIALSARASKLEKTQRKLSFTAEGPSEMTAACRVWTKRPVKAVKADGSDIPFTYDEASGTTYFRYVSDGNPVKIAISF